MKIHWCNRTGIQLPHMTLVRSQRGYDKVLKHLGLPKGEPFLGGGDACCHTFQSNKGFVHVISVTPEARGKDALGLLVHEGAHVWQHFTRDIGEDTPSDEFEAYMLQAIFLNLLDAFKKAGGKL